MVLDKNKKIEISNLGASIVAILLMAIYFIHEFLNDSRFLVAGIYVVILVLCIRHCAEKACFHKSVYNFIVLLILSELLRNSIPYFKNPVWFLATVFKQFVFPKTNYIKMVFSTPYIYVYLIGALLFLIYKMAPRLCDSHGMKKVFYVLGKHSIWAIAVHMCAVCFSTYEILENIIFYVFIISALWNAYTMEEESAGVAKAVWLIVELFVFIQLFGEQYDVFVKKIHSIPNIPWYYLIGIWAICVICILADQTMQDTMIGFIILGTNVIFFFGRLSHIKFAPVMILLFHIIAATLYYFVKSRFALESGSTNRNLKLLYACCYVIAFLFVVFIQCQYTKSIILLCLGLLVLLIYFGGIGQIKGTIYGTIVYGAVPWILLETTMASLGKLHSSLIPVVLFTIMFWCMCSVVLSWKDSANIKAIAFEKVNSEMIINGLAVIAYVLTAVVLFL